MKKIKLGILDQSVVQKNKSPKDAVDETVDTVKLAEQLGYSRFWVSEHHNSTFIAGSTPEILMVKLAEVTDHIRIGSGGIMLPNHSALKVAENFRMLETLFPGRIDLGMGRAPGTDRLTSSLLNPSNDFAEESYLRQLDHLQNFFSDTAYTRDNRRILAVPQCETVPDQWILSSSGGSSLIAARFGLGLVVAKFINGFATREVIDTYKKNFKPSEYFPLPKAMLSIFVLCAETDTKVKEMRKFMDYIFIQFEKGNFHDFGDYETIQKYVFTQEELERINYNSGRIISGTPASVKQQLEKLAAEFDVDEIIISTMAGNAADRKRSFELIAQAFELTPAN
ncbi:LLM class flavin-dependent oxidoreductase [Cytophaga hutchinsonii]|uniref:Luciferase-like monooxygenase family protein n=1 Tax=Cytophaga hutchinsonii (strain ATCC 33406 / DSM 1761 / CIP 103989 / NBRC 15051 / NCIMB 9469 / D465) TaxID=269798 RepID=A0A6N4SUR1_CYTH3|nr:LLM class flavin-dependent oxidoreductase [Cytophaga hutchinsonii]ABG60124.1 luciferase-like monooxygenase family protein [Cytophaga hutchinsonii ATCC 33406]SFX23681.1 luciferase family oxidoreductase, group 1 [Cytophaga hutchinsonii ATCC 33406]